MEFEEYVEQVEDALCVLGNVQTKTINYGVQFVLTAAGKKTTLNVYHGKKGISLVWGGEDSELRTKADAALRSIQTDGAGEAHRNNEPRIAAYRHVQQNEAGSSAHTSNAGDPARLTRSRDGEQMSATRPRALLNGTPDFSGVWMGTDESGKGDYFGPLVVAAVCLDETSAETLIRLGVKDCKDLSDEKALALADAVEKNALATSVLVMKPHVYNMRYEQVKQQGANLNTLLALGHIAAIKQALQKYPACKWVIVDQFAQNRQVDDGVHAFAPDMQVWQRARGEEDIAVAAASVLARGAFLQNVRLLAREAKIGRIPKGGGEAATNAARRLAQIKGADALGHFVKLHFANTEKVLGNTD